MITIVGLGPAGLERVHPSALEPLLNERNIVVVRTLDHPAAAALAQARRVIACDDLYDAATNYDDLYTAVASRVVEAAGPVVYAVPGSALVGERAVPLIRQMAAAADREIQIHAGESFVDLALEHISIDPIADGLQILDARDLPDPLPLHLPTLISQVDTAGIAADLATELGRVLAHDTPMLLLSDLGSTDESIVTTTLEELPLAAIGPRTTAFLAAQEVGWIGLVRTNRVLREQCPWDRRQTHRSLLKHLVEEAYESIDAIEHLGPEAPLGQPDYGAYAEVEEELGDLLLQVVFHATMAREAGVFDVEEVAEGIRRKLVSRHPHVFGDLELNGSAAVEANWERLKTAEKRRESPMDDVPTALPGLARAEKIQRRAASVGFDWRNLEPVVAKLVEEVAELQEALGDQDRTAAELGDVLFAAVNVARHVGVDADLAVRSATRRFEERFRWIESRLGDRDMGQMSLPELDDFWEAAKDAGIGGS